MSLFELGDADFEMTVGEFREQISKYIRSLYEDYQESLSEGFDLKGFLKLVGSVGGLISSFFDETSEELDASAEWFLKFATISGVRIVGMSPEETVPWANDMTDHVEKFSDIAEGLAEAMGSGGKGGGSSEEEPDGCDGDPLPDLEKRPLEDGEVGGAK